MARCVLTLPTFHSFYTIKFLINITLNGLLFKKCYCFNKWSFLIYYFFLYTNKMYVQNVPITWVDINCFRKHMCVNTCHGYKKIFIKSQITSNAIKKQMKSNNKSLKRSLIQDRYHSSGSYTIYNCPKILVYLTLLVARINMGLVFVFFSFKQAYPQVKPTIDRVCP